MTEPISVLIVDDHPVVRRGLRVLLEVQDGIEVAGEAGDGATALALAAELTPDAVHAGQLEVEQDDVRGEFGGQGDRGGAVAGLAGHLDPVLHLEQHPQAAPDHRVVVHDQDRDRVRHPFAFPGTVIRTVVPFRVDVMTSFPPTDAARSRIEASPSPRDGASGTNPRPSSDTSRTTRRPAFESATRTPVAPACRSALCSASCATR